LLTSQPQLQYPNFSKPFILTTDATNEALGAVLSQGDIGRDLHVGYASRTLGKAELNYPTVEKELLTIVWECKYFMQYLLGRNFSVVADHRPLVWIFNVKCSILLRWRLQLKEYEYNIVYKRGSSNTNADALSRIRVAETIPTEREKLNIFQEMYMKPPGGHSGINKTYDRMKLFIIWPQMNQ
jgi:hypothetical protein